MWIKLIICIIFLFISYKLIETNKCREREDTTSYKKTVEILTSLKESYANNSYYIETGEIEFPSTFLEKDSFRILFENPCIYKNSLIRVLADDNHHKLTKYIGLHALLKLCIDDYIDVLELIYHEYKKGKMDYKMLYIAVYQHEFSLEVVKNYKNLKLRKLLKSIQKDFKKQGINDEVINIDEILSGKAWSESIDFYTSGAAGYIPWYCGSRFY